MKDLTRDKKLQTFRVINVIKNNKTIKATKQ